MEGQHHETLPSQEHHGGSHTERPEHEPKPSSLKSKWPFLVIAILLVLVGVFGGYFILSQTSNKSAIQPEIPSPGPNVFEGTSTPTLTSTQLKSFTSAKFSGLSFKGYSLMYPEDWILTEERSEDPTPISTVTLSKNGYTLKIFQAATGGAQCIYEGEMPEGPASDYRNNIYKDIESFATLRQTQSPSNGKMAYNYCQKNTSDGSFGQPTSVGHMSVSTPVAVPDPSIVSEFENIVKSIKTL